MLSLSEKMKLRQSCQLTYNAIYRFLSMLSYVIMAPHNILCLSSKFVYGIRGHPVGKAIGFVLIYSLKFSEFEIIHFI